MTNDFVVAIAALWLLAGCGGPHNDASGQQARLAAQAMHGYRELTYEEVLERLSAANVIPSRLYDAIIELSMDARSNPVVCQVLRSLWDGDPPAEFNPKHLSVPVVRFSLASVLHRCGDEDDDPQYYAYVMSILEQSPDESDRMRAAISLGVVGSDKDIERLRSYAVGPSTKLAVGAVGGLSLLNSAAADEALKAIAAATSLARDVRKSAESALKQ